MGTPLRSNVYDANKNYKDVIVIGGRQDEDFGTNLLQSIQDHERKNIMDVLINQTAVLSGFASPTLNNSTGVATIPSGFVYVNGHVELVPGNTLNYGSTVATNTIYLEWLYQQVTATQDNTLVDPNTLNPVFEASQVVTSLVQATPDAFDETFDIWVTGVPQNYYTGTPWSVTSGTVAQGTPAQTDTGNYALQLNYSHGTATTIVSPSFSLTGSTTYTVYYWTKTVYGQTDLAASDGATVTVNITGSPAQTFATTGGTTLIGGYTQHSFTFNSGTATTATVTINIPATATPTSTQILLDTLLVTSQAFTSSLQTERHFYPLFNWFRATTPTVLTNVVTYKTQVQFADVQGTLPGSRVSGMLSSNVTLDHSAAGDITGPDEMSALTQLATLRAPVAGSSTQAFQVANATVSTQAVNASQVQTNGVSYATDTGSANNYIIAPSPAVGALVAGLEVKFKAANSNTGASTLTVSGLTPSNLVDAQGNTLAENEIIAGQIIDAVYDGSVFRFTKQSPYIVYQSGSPIYAADTGVTAGVYVVALNPSPSSYVAGLTVRFKANTTNPGGGETLNINGMGAKSLVFNGGHALLANDILQNQIVEVTYDGTVFQLTSPTASTVTDTGNTSSRKGFKNSLNTNGYTVFPSGLIMQWFTTPSLTAGTPYTATLPLAFTSTYLFGFCTQLAGGGTVAPIVGNLTQVTVTPGTGASGNVFTCVVLGV